MTTSGPTTAAPPPDLTDANINAAVIEWLDPAETEKTWGDISEWDVSRVTTMLELFKDKTKADEFNDDISGWDVDAVTNMAGMFEGAKAFNRDIGVCMSLRDAPRPHAPPHRASRCVADPLAESPPTARALVPRPLTQAAGRSTRSRIWRRCSLRRRHSTNP